MSRPLSNRFAPPFSSREGLLSSADDPRLRDIVDEVRALSMSDLTVFVDAFGGARTVAPFATEPVILIGDLLVEDATAAELRFHLARAAKAIELGFVILDCGGAVIRSKLVDALRGYSDPKLASALSLDREVDILRDRLDIGEVSRLQPIVESIARGETPPEILSWAEGVSVTANRFGFLMAGELEAAVRGWRRAEIRIVGEPFDTPTERRSALRRWPELTDLLAFALSAEYGDLARAMNQAPRSERFGPTT